MQNTKYFGKRSSLSWPNSQYPINIELSGTVETLQFIFFLCLYLLSPQSTKDFRQFREVYTSQKKEIDKGVRINVIEDRKLVKARGKLEGRCAQHPDPAWLEEASPECDYKLPGDRNDDRRTSSCETDSKLFENSPIGCQVLRAIPLEMCS